LLDFDVANWRIVCNVKLEFLFFFRECWVCSKSSSSQQVGSSSI